VNFATLFVFPKQDLKLSKHKPFAWPSLVFHASDGGEALSGSSGSLEARLACHSI
jgi:hypothetical protein